MFVVVTWLRFFYFIVPYGSSCLWESECFGFFVKILHVTIQIQMICQQIILMYEALSDEDHNASAHRMLICSYWL